jgi:hypothetical protein
MRHGTARRMSECLAPYLKEIGHGVFAQKGGIGHVKCRASHPYLMLRCVPYCTVIRLAGGRVESVAVARRSWDHGDRLARRQVG